MGVFILIVIAIVIIVGIVAIANTKTTYAPEKVEKSPPAYVVNENVSEDVEQISTVKTPAGKKSEQAEVLRNKAEQLNTLNSFLVFLLILFAVVYGIAIANIFEGIICTILVVSDIIGTIISIYATNVILSSKSELCKGQAEILDKLG